LSGLLAGLQLPETLTREIASVEIILLVVPPSPSSRELGKFHSEIMSIAVSHQGIAVVDSMTKLAARKRSVRIVDAERE